MSNTEAEILVEERTNVDKIRNKRILQVLLGIICLILACVEAFCIAFGIAFLIPPPDLLQGPVLLSVSAVLLCFIIFLVIIIIRINRKVKILKENQTKI